MNSVKLGQLVVISGPSGVGKSTVVGQVLQELAGRLARSVSATTRQPRPGEREGVDYWFLAPEDFARRLAAGEFLEAVEVFGPGHWYGTLWSAVRPSLEAGKWVLLEIDVAGADKVLRLYPEALTIFLQPASFAELERRLRSRGTETEEAVELRLATASREIAQAQRYTYQVVNDTVPQAVADILKILKDRGIFDD